MDDKSKWYLFLQGDKKALSDIFLDYHDDLFNYGMKLSGHQDIVKDAIQDLFLKLWKNKNNLNTIQSIKPYLIKSLRHHVLDSLELRKSWQSIDKEYESIQQVTYSHEDFLISNQIDEEIHQQVINTLNKLTIRQREAIYLRYFENLDFETVAQIMEMNVQSVRNTIYRATQLMRDMMLLPIFFIMLEQTSFNMEIFYH
jgi:RNA polymerase sigma factor (sigma-70 family)